MMSQQEVEECSGQELVTTNLIMIKLDRVTCQQHRRGHFDPSSLTPPPPPYPLPTPFPSPSSILFGDKYIIYKKSVGHVVIAV